MFGRKQQPLLHCDIVHDLPGRVRLRCRALRYLSEQEHELQQRLQDRPGIRTARVTCLTTGVLIVFDPEAMTLADVTETVQSAIGNYSLIAFKAERLELARQTVQERRLNEEPLREMVTRVVVTTVSLLFSFRRPTSPSASILGRFLTMPALTSLSLALPILRSGTESLVKSFRPNADTLSATAIVASILAGRDLSALTIIWLADIAELLTAYSMDRTRKAIREMLSVGEEEVWRLTDNGEEERVPLEALRPDDRVLAGAGEKISVDGFVETGEASVDQASITGEFMPAHKRSGDQVFAGTVVKSGRIVVKAQQVGDQTAVSRIVHMVEEASHRKANIQAFADRFSAALIPVNFLLSLIVYLVTKNSGRALNMLIIDYSCGVRLSTATAIASAICTAARHRILIKGGNYLELLDQADTLILDKTGTLTEGTAQITSVVPLNDNDERRVLELAAAAEEVSSHPMAVAILEKVRRSGYRIPKHTNSQTHVARGVETSVNKARVLVGNKRFLEDNRVDLTPAVDHAGRLARRGENILYVAHGGELVGILGVQDVLRENMKKALNRLRFSKIDDIILLTGDVEQNAEIVASRMAMDGFRAEQLPEDKAETVLRLQSRGTRVVMVGDGINDAPALAYADVGIAIGATRTDIAMEASDITVAGDNPLMIPSVINLGKKTMSIVRQNFGIAVAVNSVGLVLGSIGILPVVWAAVLHNATTVAVVVNSARMLLYDIENGRS
ncbi:heavy metal translocating P-type ATPase [candidate division GN15 bacterium]|nr:heavy metal translocating P-type ATPase [candidate division GN15 bacterium]